jgi:hypothetical protein
LFEKSYDISFKIIFLIAYRKKIYELYYAWYFEKNLALNTFVLWYSSIKTSYIRYLRTQLIRCLFVDNLKTHRRVIDDTPEKSFKVVSLWFNVITDLQRTTIFHVALNTFVRKNLDTLTEFTLRKRFDYHF